MRERSRHLCSICGEHFTQAASELVSSQLTVNLMFNLSMLWIGRLFLSFFILPHNTVGFLLMFFITEKTWTWSAYPRMSPGLIKEWTMSSVRPSNRPFSKMAVENLTKSKWKTNTSNRKSTFTLVTLPSFSISGEISAEKMWVENCKIYRRLYDWGYNAYPQSYKRL